LKTPDERALVKRAKQNDKDAMEELFRINYPVLLGVLVCSIGDADVAEDIAQEAVLSAIVNLERYQPRAKFSTWLISIALNKYRNKLRVKTREVSVDSIDKAHSGTESVEDPALQRLAAAEGLHEDVESVARRAVECLDAKPVKGGQYTVILDPGLAGVFVHEAFGHLSESDFIYEDERMREIMVLGREFGAPILNIVDSAALPGERGSYKYDDEGVPSTKTYLIKDGILVGRLHSRETAGKLNEAPTGNARAMDYRHRPIVRMTNTYIENGTSRFEDMISDIDEGIYAIDAYGGQTTMEMFTFSSREAFMIRKGKIAERVRDVVLTGNVFDTLKNIEAIGNDLKISGGGTGGCGKGGQWPLPVSDGSPHIRIRNVVVGGR
jgi:TldD protein